MYGCLLKISLILKEHGTVSYHVVSSMICRFAANSIAICLLVLVKFLCPTQSRFSVKHLFLQHCRHNLWMHLRPCGQTCDNRIIDFPSTDENWKRNSRNDICKPLDSDSRGTNRIPFSRERLACWDGALFVAASSTASAISRFLLRPRISSSESRLSAKHSLWKTA